MSCSPFSNCEIFSDNRRIAVVKENKRKFVGQNSKNHLLSLLQVDECLIKGDKIKCDFLLLNCEIKTAYFIELKGLNFLHGIEQLISSINILSSRITEFTINARIIPSKIYPPNLRDSRTIRLEKLVKKYNGTFAKGEIQLIEKIS